MLHEGRRCHALPRVATFDHDGRPNAASLIIFVRYPIIVKSVGATKGNAATK